WLQKNSGREENKTGMSSFSLLSCHVCILLHQLLLLGFGQR
ncbi:unnamed protein product, partial [Brassica rapa subsp. narinosa]